MSNSIDEIQQMLQMLAQQQGGGVGGFNAFSGFGHTAAAFGRPNTLFPSPQEATFARYQAGFAQMNRNNAIRSDNRVDQLINVISNTFGTAANRATLREGLNGSGFRDLFGTLINLPMINKFIGGSSGAMHEGFALASARGAMFGASGPNYVLGKTSDQIVNAMDNQIKASFYKDEVFSKQLSGGFDLTDIGVISSMLGAKGGFSNLDFNTDANKFGKAIKSSTEVLQVIRGVFGNRDTMELMNLAQEITGMDFNVGNLGQMKSSLSRIKNSASIFNVDERQMLEMSAMRRKTLESMGMDSGLAGFIATENTIRSAGVTGQMRGILNKAINNPVRNIAYFHAIGELEMASTLDSASAGILADPRGGVISAALKLAADKGDTEVFANGINVESARAYLSSNGRSAAEVIRGYGGLSNLHRNLSPDDKFRLTRGINNERSMAIEREAIAATASIAGGVENASRIYNAIAEKGFDVDSVESIEPRVLREVRARFSGNTVIQSELAQQALARQARQNLINGQGFAALDLGSNSNVTSLVEDFLKDQNYNKGTSNRIEASTLRNSDGTLNIENLARLTGESGDDLRAMDNSSLMYLMTRFNKFKSKDGTEYLISSEEVYRLKEKASLQHRTSNLKDAFGELQNFNLDDGIDDDELRSLTDRFIEESNDGQLKFMRDELDQAQIGTAIRHFEDKVGSLKSEHSTAGNEERKEALEKQIKELQNAIYSLRGESIMRIVEINPLLEYIIGTVTKAKSGEQ